MRQVTCTVFVWAAWRRLVGLHFFRLKGMWALSIRLGPVGVEINNNSVWTLTERCR